MLFRIARADVGVDPIYTWPICYSLTYWNLEKLLCQIWRLNSVIKMRDRGMSGLWGFVFLGFFCENLNAA